MLIKRQHAFLVDRMVTASAASAVVVVIAVLLGILGILLFQAQPAFNEYGLGFLFSSRWNGVSGREMYGIFPAIVGTLYTSLVALAIAVPLGVGTAIFLSEPILPRPLIAALTTLIELLAAIPSVVLGLWGIFVVIPTIKPIGMAIHESLGWIPFFSKPPVGPGIHAAGLILAMMILPIITSVTKESLAAVPSEYRMGAFGLGATRWETAWLVTVRAAKSGILGGIMLAFARALGETMAVTMVIGNSISANIAVFSPGVTISSLIANSFPEASALQLSALMYAALVLMAISLMVNVFAYAIAHRKS
jgi:phosphate transport system permease protein